jgi:hypothetical protein
LDSRSRRRTKIRPLSVRAKEREEEEEKRKEALKELKHYFILGTMINLVRISAFIWAYMYHDWQAVPLLICILHSCVYWKKWLFKACMQFLYCPYIILYLFWLFVVNIPGIWAYDNRKEYYKYGFYKYQVPVLE